MLPTAPGISGFWEEAEASTEGKELLALLKHSPSNWHPLKLCRMNQQVPSKECLRAEKPSRAPSNTGIGVIYSIFILYVYLFYIELINN